MSSNPLDDEPGRYDDERLRFRFNALDDLTEVMEGLTRGLMT